MSKRLQTSDIATGEDLKYTTDDARHHNFQKKFESQDRAIKELWAAQINTQQTVADILLNQMTMKSQLNDISKILHTERILKDTSSSATSPVIVSASQEQGVYNRGIDLSTDNDGLEMRIRSLSTG